MTSNFYTELTKLQSYDERLRYLQDIAKGHRESPREISMSFYKSSHWRTLRKTIQDRDFLSDMGLTGMMINDGRIIIHHIDPLTLEDIETRSDKCYDPENLITVSELTHNKIHYAKKSEPLIERSAGDTKLW